MGMNVLLPSEWNNLRPFFYTKYVFELSNSLRRKSAQLTLAGPYASL